MEFEKVKFQQKKSKKLLLWIVIVSLLTFGMIGIVGCSQQEQSQELPKEGINDLKEESTSTAPEEKPLEKITFQLNWLPEDPVYWAALDKGFWKEEGLDVRIIKGNGSADTVAKIAIKQAEIGMADISPLILGRAREGIKVKAVANYLTYFPAVVMYNNDRGIKEPKDLEGKTIIDAANSAWYLFFPAFARSTGIDLDKVNFKFADPALHEPTFIKGEVDAWLADIESIPSVESLTEEPASFFSYREDGNIECYSHSIIVHEDTIKERPELIKKFLVGFLKGVNYCLEHPSEVGEIVQKYVPEIDPELTVEAWQLGIDYNLYQSDESKEKGLGWMSRDRMDSTIKLILDAYDVDKELAPEEVYTSEFLPEEPIYPKR